MKRGCKDKKTLHFAFHPRASAAVSGSRLRIDHDEAAFGCADKKAVPFHMIPKHDPLKICSVVRNGMHKSAAPLAIGFEFDFRLVRIGGGHGDTIALLDGQHFGQSRWCEVSAT